MTSWLIGGLHVEFSDTLAVQAAISATIPCREGCADRSGQVSSIIGGIVTWQREEASFPVEPTEMEGFSHRKYFHA